MENINHPATILFKEVQQNYNEIYQDILRLIRPHRIESIVRIFKDHLDHSGVDLKIFNDNRSKIPNFLLRFVKCCLKNFPSPGDAFGIKLTCKITKTNTQNTLDSRHLKEKSFQHNTNPVGINNSSNNNNSKALKYELELYSDQSQILEIAGKRKYSSVFVKNYSLRDLLSIFPYESCIFPSSPDIVTENDFYHGLDGEGKIVNCQFTRFLFVSTAYRCSGNVLITNNDELDKSNHIIRIVYQSYARDLTHLLKHLEGDKIVAYNDVKSVFQKCGIACYFFNMVRVVRIMNREKHTFNRRHLHDLMCVIKYQCRSGIPLPLNREGLAKNPERSPLEVLSFEAPKKNFVRLSTINDSLINYPVVTSADKIFVGQQFKDGTGYSFAILPLTE